jgi:acyl-CoA synthetase (AMP-forming)/AMP-acid ligase II
VVGHRYLEGWGMTEASGGLVTVTSVDDVVVGNEADDFFGSAGRPSIEVVIRVVDEEGNDLPHDGESVGELIVSSPQMIVGYWNNPEATAAALRDGWYHSGDLGSMDAAGYVYVTERRNDLIVSGGMNVYPSEVERCLWLLDGVTDVAVVGVPHERWGQTPVAVVVAAPGSALTEVRVLEHCRTQIAKYKWPSRVVFADALPRSASQKVLKRVLRDQLSASLV